MSARTEAPGGNARRLPLRLTYRAAELLISVALLLLGIGVFIGAGQITRLPNFEDVVGARGFAYFVGAATVLLSLLLIGVQAWRLWRGKTTLNEPEDPDVTGDDPRYPASTLQAAGVVAVMFIAVLALNSVGYILSVGAFLAAGFAIMGTRGWRKLIVYPVTFAISTYLFFDTVLKVRLPAGILRPLLDLLGLE